MRFVKLTFANFHCSLQIDEEDILPKNLCQKCLSDLTFVHDFIIKCQKSEEILQTSLASNENAITYNKNIEIKIEEHDLQSESEIKTENTVVDEEYDEESTEDVTDRMESPLPDDRKYFCITILLYKNIV